MSLSVGEIEAVLALRDELTPQLRRAIQTLQQARQEAAQFDAATAKGAAAATKSIDNFNTHVGRIGQGLQSAGRGFTVAFTVPVVAGLVSATKAAMDYDSAFANVKKTMTGTDAEFASISSEIRKLSKEIPKSAEELANIAAIGGQFGISKGGIIEFTRTVADLSVAIDGITAETAAASLAQIANATRTSEQDFRKLGDVLVDLGNKGSSTEGIILEFTTRLAGAGSSIGLTQAQIFGVGAAMANLGINAEAGGTAMSKVFREMNVAVATGGAALDEFAKVSRMSTQDFARAFSTDPIKAIEAFIGGLQSVKAEGGNLTQTLHGLGITESRMTMALELLANSTKGIAVDVRTAEQAWLGLNDGMQTNGALSEEATKKYQTFANQLRIFNNQLEDAKITLGNAILPILLDVMRAAQPLIVAFDKLTMVFAALPTPVQQTALAFALALAAVGPLLYIVGGLAQGVLALTGAYTGLSAILATNAVAAGANAAAATTAATATGVAATALNTFSVSAGVATRATYTVSTAMTAQAGAATAAAAATTAAAGTATTAVGLLTAALGLLGKALAVVTVAWGAWNLGRHIGETTGLTDAIGKHVAGVWEMVGILPEGSQAQYDASRAAAKHREELGQLNPAMRETTVRAQAMAATLRSLTSASQAKDIEAMADEVLKLAKSGELNTKIMQQVARDIEAMEFTGKLPEVLKNIVDAYGKAGQAARQAGGAQVSMAEQFDRAQKAIAKLTQAQRDEIVAGDAIGKNAEVITGKLKEQWPALEITAEAVQMYIDSLSKGGKTMAEVAQGPFDKLRDTLVQLNAEMRAGERQGPAAYAMSLEDLGEKLLEAERKAKRLGQVINKELREDMARAGALIRDEWARSIKNMDDIAPGGGQFESKDPGTEVFEEEKKTAQRRIKLMQDTLAVVDRLNRDSLANRIAAIEQERSSLIAAAAAVGDFTTETLSLIDNFSEAKKLAIVADMREVQAAVIATFAMIPGALPAAQVMLTEFSEESNNTLTTGKNKTVEWESALGGLASAFADLAEISGQGLDGTLGKIASMIALLEIAGKVGQGLGDLFTRKDAVTGKSELSLSGFKNADGKFTAGSVAIGGMQTLELGMAAYGTLNKATDVMGRGNRAARGALAGARIGANPALAVATGGMSIIIGAGIGALVGALRNPAFEDVFNRVGKNWGTVISEQLARKIADTAKKGFKGDRQAAEIAHFGDILGEAGGLKDSNFDTFIGKFRDVFVMFETGKFSLEQTQQLIGQNFGKFAEHILNTGRLATKEFAELIQLNKRLGVMSGEVLAFVAQQAARAGKAIAAMFTDTVDRGTEVFERLQDAKDDLAALQEKWDETSARSDFDPNSNSTQSLLDDLTKARDKVRELEGEVKRTAESSRAEFGRLGVLALGVFNGALNAGLSFNQALEAARPALDQISTMMETLGLESENAAVKALVIANKVSQSAAGAAAGAMNEAILALSNFGALNEETLDALEGQLGTVFTRIQSEVEQMGGTHQDAMLQILPFLQKVIQASEEYGLTIDPATQLLIDQAREMGMLGETAESETDVMKRGFAEVVQVILDLTAALRGLPTALPNPFADWRVPPPGTGAQPPGGAPPGGGAPEPQPVPEYAEGSFSGGSWYRNFDPRGELALLHGKEAVVPQGREMEFVRDVMNRNGTMSIEDLVEYVRQAQVSVSEMVEWSESQLADMLRNAGLFVRELDRADIGIDQFSKMPGSALERLGLDRTGAHKGLGGLLGKMSFQRRDQADIGVPMHTDRAFDVSTGAAIEQARALFRKHGFSMTDADLSRMGERFGYRDSESVLDSREVNEFLSKLEKEYLANVQGFATGTFSGSSWYHNFDPRGEVALLHGEEAVIRRDQEMAFASDVIARSGAGYQGFEPNDWRHEMPAFDGGGVNVGFGSAVGGEGSGGKTFKGEAQASAVQPVIVYVDGAGLTKEEINDQVMKAFPESVALNKHGVRTALTKLVNGGRRRVGGR